MARGLSRLSGAAFRAAGSRGRWRFLGAVLVVFCLIARADAQLTDQREQYDADVPKTIFELQPFRTQTHARLGRANGMVGNAMLVDLNPQIGVWYVLSFVWSGTASVASYHLENARMAAPLRLDSGNGRGLSIVGRDGARCVVWQDGGASAVETANSSGLPYAPLCDGALYLRNLVAGHRTSLERITDFLRDKVWGGDKVIAFVKKQFYRDAFLEQSESGAGSVAPATAAPVSPAALAPEAEGRSIVPERLALDVDTSAHALQTGRWYPLRDVPDAFVSTIAPEDIEARLRVGHERSVNPLDSVESGALVYLVAFDLAAFDLHFVLGTDHPRLDWSDRPPPSSQNSALPGPDGIASAAPVVRNGMVSPTDAERTIAAFAGGFKRSHGAFRHGELSERNHGSHYGFVEEGVIFSKLHPGLATVVAMDDGSVDVRTWAPEDDARLAHVRYARQNGVPLIEYDEQRGAGVPGDFVNLWGPGNWSGSANEDLRTLRAGLCLQTNAQGRYLIYAYFSAATPSAMARVFQAYHCRYAMHLDMNALEHTYFALYAQRGGARVVEHLVSGMEEVDRSARGELVPRFVGFPDDRDFFYMTRRRAR